MTDAVHLETHEELCPRAGSPLSICCCDVVRAAYQQARKDAEQEVMVRLQGFNHNCSITDCWFCAISVEAMTAARGVYERGQVTNDYERSHNYGESATIEDCCCGWVDAPACRSCKCCNWEGGQG